MVESWLNYLFWPEDIIDLKNGYEVKEPEISTTEPMSLTTTHVLLIEINRPGVCTMQVVPMRRVFIRSKRYMKLPRDSSSLQHPLKTPGLPGSPSHLLWG